MFITQLSAKMIKKKIYKPNRLDATISPIQEFQEALEEDNIKTKQCISTTKKEISATRAWLKNIQNSKFYRLWQTYNILKKLFIPFRLDE